MTERVRAVLVPPGGCMLAIRRDRPGRAAYWALPGGHVDPEDQRREAALAREISEEIAGQADITSLLYILDSGTAGERQYFYLGRISCWSFAARTGPEFSEADRGTYQVEQISLTVAELDAIDLKPPAAALLLRDAIASGRDLFTLPDLRSARPVPLAKTRFRGDHILAGQPPLSRCPITTACENAPKTLGAANASSGSAPGLPRAPAGERRQGRPPAARPAPPW